MSTAFANTPIIDCDSHVAEPADLWTSRLPAKYTDDAPHLQWDDRFGEMRWRVGDDLLRGEAEFAQAGWHEFPPSHPVSLAEADPVGIGGGEPARANRLELRALQHALGGEGSILDPS